MAFHSFCKQAGASSDDFSCCQVQRRIMDAAAWRAGLENKPANFFMLQVLYLFTSPAHELLGPVLTGPDGDQTGGHGFANQLHRLPWHGKPGLDLRTNGDPLNVLSKCISQIVVEFMPAVIADSIPEETGAYDDFYFLFHRSNKNALSNFTSGRLLTGLPCIRMHRASSFSLRQPFLKTGARFLGPVPFTVTTDGHVLAAGSEPIRAISLRYFLGFSTSRFIDIRDF